MSAVMFRNMRYLIVAAICFASMMLTNCEKEKQAHPQKATVVGNTSNECPAKTVTLTATATDADSFQWKKDGVVIAGQSGSTLTVTAGGTYTAAGVNDAGVGAFSDPKSVTITICPPERPTLTGDLTNICPDTTVTLTAATTDADSFQWKKDGSVIASQSVATLTVTESGTYTVAGVNSSGVGTFSEPKTVTISDCRPGKATISGARSNQCPTATVVLTASADGLNLFQWKKDGVIIKDRTGATLTVTESGTYTVAGVNSSGVGTFSEPKTVTISDCRPGKATISGARSNQCPTATVVLTASADGLNLFQWKKDGVIIKDRTGATLTVTESGTYTVAGVNNSGVGTFSEPHRVTITSCVPLPVSGFTYRDDLDVFSLTGTSTGKITDYQWNVSGSSDVKLIAHSAASATLELPASAKTVTVNLTVRNEGGSSTSTQQIALPALTLSRLYGLGRNTTAEKSNNVTHSWYIDQKNTGRHSSINCGPTCATMAAKWYNSAFAKRVEDARNTYRPEGGWWYTDDIEHYLNDNHIGNFYAGLNHASDLKSRIDNGHIVILCLDMHYVRKHLGKSEWHIDKYYPTSVGFGHFIIVKGYKIVDGIVWFEVYDPNSWGSIYNNRMLKGLDRYYRAEDIMHATDVWWKYMIVIDNPSVPTLRRGALDPSTIVHQKGR